MNHNSIIYHPFLKKYIIVTRKYSNICWYFKLVTNSIKEFKSLHNFKTMIQTKDVLKIGDFVTINTDDIRWNISLKRSVEYINFITQNKNTVFKVAQAGEIVSLENCPYTFWVGHLILVD